MKTARSGDRAERYRTVLWGVGIALAFAERLIELRQPGLGWGVLTGGLALVTAGLLIWREEKSADAARSLVWLLFIPLYATLYACRRHEWAQPLAGVATAAYSWAAARLRRRRWPIAMAGCLVAGVAVRLAPWPNEQRLLLVFVAWGLAVALQGIWEIAQGAPAGAAPPDGERKVPLASLILGRIEYAPIVEPELDLKIRMRDLPPDLRQRIG